MKKSLMDLASLQTVSKSVNYLDSQPIKSALRSVSPSLSQLSLQHNVPFNYTSGNNINVYL